MSRIICVSLRLVTSSHLFPREAEELWAGKRQLGCSVGSGTKGRRGLGKQQESLVTPFLHLGKERWKSYLDDLLAPQLYDKVSSNLRS